MVALQQKTALRELLARSRARSTQKHRLAVGTRAPILRLQETELSPRRERFQDLIGGAAAELDPSTLLPSKSRYCLLVSDAEGVVLECYAPEGTETEFQRHGLTVGGIWNERLAGTNGISIALESGNVVTVSGEDHFYRCFSRFACSSTPLTDAQNNLIGSITLVGAVGRRPDEIGLCEQTLHRASRQFQTRLFRNYHSDKMTARLMSRDPATRRCFETLVACDDRGDVIFSLPLWRDDARPELHQNLVGRHLSELHDLEVSLRGPARVPPRRYFINSGTPNVPARLDKTGPLAGFANQGAAMPNLVERARKLAAYRVPLLICGAPGGDSREFAQAIIGDLGLISPTGVTLDANSPNADTSATEALDAMQFLGDYPVERFSPTLVLENVEQLGGAAQARLKQFLEADERANGDRFNEDRALVLFTSDRPWQQLQNGGIVQPGLLHLIGQSVLDLPPLRLREVEQLVRAHLARDRATPPQVSDQAMRLLCDYDWPGNQREMRAVLREALICGNGGTINVTDLPDRIREQPAEPKRALVRHSLRDALNSTDWNVSKAARLLGISRATINRWIATEGLQRPE
ncbi:sigma-54-dependent Fis family transcriptional regulator [Thalassobius sp. S69A]|uniref:sigma-54-dependent Fis family transcriptional regulator n=1 Tax=unclassified Thalassovita TaxID=2619711 RepID=UPI000C0E8FCA|nr:hypothetical protein [Paracoccaceae bacterium]MBT26981.1 hypothetical protein [Paracoccaceae bacterium]